MEATVSFPLFGDGGFVNPTLWQPSYPGELPPEAFGPAVWDFDYGRWRVKQTREFDGGWRWFDTYDIAALTLYNVKLDKRSFTLITHQEIENTLIGPEFVLMCAKSRVILDHNFFTARKMMADKIRSNFLKLRRELLSERMEAV